MDAFIVSYGVGYLKRVGMLVLGVAVFCCTDVALLIEVGECGKEQDVYNVFVYFSFCEVDFFS